MDSGRPWSLRGLALLLVLPAGGDQTEAGLGPETRQAQVGRLPRETGPRLHRRAGGERRVVWWQTSLHQVESFVQYLGLLVIPLILQGGQKKDPRRCLCSSLLPWQWGQVWVPDGASSRQTVTPGDVTPTPLSHWDTVATIIPGPSCKQRQSSFYLLLNSVRKEFLRRLVNVSRFCEYIELQSGWRI